MAVTVAGARCGLQRQNLSIRPTASSPPSRRPRFAQVDAELDELPLAQKKQKQEARRTRDREDGEEATATAWRVGSLARCRELEDERSLLRYLEDNIYLENIMHLKASPVSISSPQSRFQPKCVT